MFSLQKLGSQELHQETIELARQDRVVTERLLWHLREIERRRMYLLHHTQSLFEYCTKILKYSEGSASRRVAASRLLRDLPELSEKLLDGQLNLSTMALAQTFMRSEETRTSTRFSEEKKRGVVSSVQGVSQDQARRILLEKFPEAPAGRERSRPLAEGGKEFTFKVSAEFLAKYERVRAQHAHDPKFQSKAGLFEALLDEALRESLRPNRSTQSFAAEAKPCVRGRRTYLSVHVRSELQTRSGGRCEHVEDGVRCSRRYHLQVDHITPVAAGGSNELANLQMLCRPHNLMKG